MIDPENVIMTERDINTENTPVTLLNEHYFSAKSLAYLWKILEEDYSILFTGSYSTNLDKVRDSLEYFENHDTYTTKLGYKELPQDTANKLLIDLESSANSVHLTLREDTAQDAISKIEHNTNVDPYEMFDIIVVQRSLYQGGVKHIPRNIRVAELMSDGDIKIKNVSERDPRTDEWVDYTESSELMDSDDLEDIKDRAEQLGELAEEIDTVGDFFEIFPY